MMVRKLEQGLSKMDAATYAYSSTAMPMLTGTLITAAGFLPVGLARSTVGEYTFAIFAVTALALVLSPLAAVYFTPYLGYLLLKTRPAAAAAAAPGGEHEVFDTPLYERFRRVVDWCVTRRKSVIAVTLALFALGLYAFQFVERQFFPDPAVPS